MVFFSPMAVAFVAILVITLFCPNAKLAGEVSFVTSISVLPIVLPTPKAKEALFHN